LLAGVGLLALWLAAVHAAPPVIKVGQIGATMNLAYVQLQGRCVRSPSYDAARESLSFWLEDGTGELRVSAYRAEVRQMVTESRVPALGDWVEVAGTLRVQEDFTALTINAPEQLRLTRPVPVERTIGSIGPEDQFLRVRVRGQIRRVHEPYPGLTLITVRDESGAIPVAVSSDLVALSSPLPALEIGQSVLVTATVSLYRETPQLVPASTTEIVPLDRPIPVAVDRPTGRLGAADIGRMVTMQGRITGVSAFSAGVKVSLDDGSGPATVLLWQSLHDALPMTVQPGAEIRVQGEVSSYYGRFEVIPELPEDVLVLTAAPLSPQEEHAPLLAIGNVTPADVGRVLTLTGTLGEPRPFSRGVKFLLSDETGSIVLLLWQEVYDALPDASGLIAGTRVEVTGRIDEYRGTLEVVPAADGVHIME